MLSLFHFNLTCCKYVALKKNTLIHSFENNSIRQTKLTTQGFPYEEIRISDQRRKLEEGSYLLNVQILNLTLPLDVTRHSLQSACLSPDRRPLIGKKVSLIAFRQVLPNILPATRIFSCISPFPLNLCRKAWIWEKNPIQQPKIYSIPHQKNPLHKFTPSPIKSVIPSTLNSNFYVITQ